MPLGRHHIFSKIQSRRWHEAGVTRNILKRSQSELSKDEYFHKERDCDTKAKRSIASGYEIDKEVYNFHTPIFPQLPQHHDKMALSPYRNCPPPLRQVYGFLVVRFRCLHFTACLRGSNSSTASVINTVR